MKCLVIWRTDQDEFVQSVVVVSDRNIERISPNEWVKLASLSEGNSEEETDAAIAESYEILLAIPYPKRFFY